LDAVLGYQMLVEVLRREAEITRPVLRHDPLDPGHRRPPARGTASAAVGQTLRTLRVVALPQTTAMSPAHPPHLRRLQAAQPPAPLAPDRLDNPSHSDLR